MNQKNRKLVMCLTIVVSMLGSLTTSLAQESKPKTETEIRALIRMSSAKDDEAANEASQELSRLSARDVPVLAVILKKGNTCERLEAARLLVDLDGENKNLIPVLIELST